MSLSQKEPQAQQQRIAVSDVEGEQDAVKIQVERFDENLGWYTANSLEIPRSQLPLLEQSLARVHDGSKNEHAGETVVPFPTVMT